MTVAVTVREGVGECQSENTQRGLAGRVSW